MLAGDASIVGKNVIVGCTGLAGVLGKICGYFTIYTILCSTVEAHIIFYEIPKDTLGASDFVSRRSACSTFVDDCPTI